MGFVAFLVTWNKYDDDNDTAVVSVKSRVSVSEWVSEIVSVFVSDKLRTPTVYPRIRYVFWTGVITRVQVHNSYISCVMN